MARTAAALIAVMLRPFAEAGQTASQRQTLLLNDSLPSPEANGWPSPL